MTDRIANALLDDATARADILRLRLTGALEAMRTALAVMVVEPETSLARHRLRMQVDMAGAVLRATEGSALESTRGREAA